MAQSMSNQDLSQAGPRTLVLRSVRESIETGEIRPGDFLPSERQLSERFGVSRDSVRGALAELVEQGLVEATKNHRRRVLDPRAPRQRLFERCVGVISPGSSVFRILERPWVEDTHVIAQASSLVEEAGYHIFMLNPELLQREGASRYVREGLRAVLVRESALSAPERQKELGEFVRAGVSVVSYGRSASFPTCSCVYSDHVAGGRDLVRWLIERGRRRILCAWIHGKQADWLADRYRGYELGMAEAGLSPLPLVRIPPAPGDVEEGRPYFERQVRILASHLADCVNGASPVDAILTLIDPHANATAAALRLLGKAPNDDVWIAGYDNSWRYAREWAYESVGPRVTVDKDNPAAAWYLARLLLDRLEKPSDAGGSAHAVPPRVVEIVPGVDRPVGRWDLEERVSAEAQPAPRAGAEASSKREDDHASSSDGSA